MELKEAIEKRKSIRTFKDESLTEEEIQQLLWAGRKVPSAGARRPCILHVVIDKVLKERLCEAALDQKCIREAPVVIVVMADYLKATSKYHRRGYRYTFMEAGHIGQNISLMAVSLGLGCVMIGAFHDGQVKEVLGIVEDPLYLIPIGRLHD